MGGVRKKWVGIGFVDDGVPTGKEPLVLDDGKMMVSDRGTLITDVYVIDADVGKVMKAYQANPVEMRKGVVPEEALRTACIYSKKTGHVMVVAMPIAYV